MPKKSFRVFKNAKNSTFEHPKTFFLAKCFIILLSHSWKVVLQPFLDFFKTKPTWCQQQFLQIVRYLNIGLKKTFFTMLVQKQFSGEGLLWQRRVVFYSRSSHLGPINVTKYSFSLYLPVSGSEKTVLMVLRPIGTKDFSVVL